GGAFPATRCSALPLSRGRLQRRRRLGLFADDLVHISCPGEPTKRGLASPAPVEPPFRETPSPVVVPSIRVQVATRANELCPRVPLSECAIDYDGVEAGDVQSLHASFY
ncbi:unnamed protein product, partial [Ectocarpus fasciculatus]